MKPRARRVTLAAAALGAVVLAAAVVLHARVRLLLRDPAPASAGSTAPVVPAGGAA